MGCAETRFCRGRPFSEEDSCVLDDLFSMGSLFYEILTGKRPYDDMDSGDVIKLFEERVFPRVDDVRPESYARIISECWNERYHSSIDLLKDLPPIRTVASTTG